jgi:hypothetical protein
VAQVVEHLPSKGEAEFKPQNSSKKKKKLNQAFTIRHAVPEEMILHCR